MEVLLLGATGTLGRSLTGELARRGHRVRAASRGRRPGAAAGDPAWIPVDVASGAGLAAAIEGADAVLDAVNPTGARGPALDAVLSEGTRRVLDACHRAGGTHYVGISIVGIERVPYRYYQAKLRQEAVIERGPAPWSLLRATQFHQLVAHLLGRAARWPVLALPTRVLVQPIDVAEVARRLADAAERPAAGRLGDVGGPRVQPAGELARVWQRACGTHQPVVHLPLPKRLREPLQDGALCTPEHAVAGPDFAAWLQSPAAS